MLAARRDLVNVGGRPGLAARRRAGYVLRGLGPAAIVAVLGSRRAGP